MLIHPTLDQMHGLGLHGMAKAFNDLADNNEAAESWCYMIRFGVEILQQQQEQLQQQLQQQHQVRDDVKAPLLEQQGARPYTPLSLSLRKPNSNCCSSCSSSSSGSSSSSSTR